MSMFTGYEINKAGRLVVHIHDLAPDREYESFETFTVAQTAHIRQRLGHPLGERIKQRFGDDTAELGKWLEAEGIGRGELWVC